MTQPTITNVGDALRREQAMARLAPDYEQCAFEDADRAGELRRCIYQRHKGSKWLVGGAVDQSTRSRPMFDIVWIRKK